MSFWSLDSRARSSTARALALLVALGGGLLHAGCDTATPTEDEDPGRAPSASIDIRAHDYGFAHVATPREKTFTLANNGSPPPDSVEEDGTLEGDATIQGMHEEEFTIESGSGSYSLAPGDTLNITVEFDPKEDREARTARLLITHNDDDQESPIPVSLEGDGVAFEGGSGQATNPYQIATPPQLQVLDDGLLDADFVLVDDVNAAVTSDWNGGKGFVPIGDRKDGERFTGTFDGAGHTISNLRIRRPDENGVALFGALGETTLQDVTLQNVEVAGGSQVGGLVGQNVGGQIRGTDLEGTVTGDVSVGGIVGLSFGGGVVQNSRAQVTVRGEAVVGGLVGRNRESTIRRSEARNLEAGTEKPVAAGTEKPGQVGGLVGRNVRGEIQESEAEGDVVSEGERGQIGGLVGRNVNGLIRQSSHADGTIEGPVSAGGLVGTNFGGGRIHASEAGGTVISGDRGGGLVGRNAAASNVVNSRATADVEAEMNAGGLVGLNRERVHGCRMDGSVEGGTNVGGLVGTNLGSVGASYAWGAVDGGTRVGGLVGRSNGGELQQTYAVGPVSGSDPVGGLVGRQTDGSVDGSYWNTEQTGQDDPIGVRKEASVEAAGLSTDQMKGSTAAETMDRLDFDSTWATVPGAYPSLQWED